MKTKLVLLAMVLCVVKVSAQVPLNVSRNNTNSPDKYSFQKPLKSENTDLFADENAMEYIHFFSNAIDNPNTLVQVEKNKKFLKLLSFDKKLVRETKKEVIYNDSEKTISFIEINYEKEKKSYLVLLLVFSVLLTILSNILFKIKKETVSGIISFIAGLVTLVAIFDAAATNLSSILMLTSVLVGIYFIDKKSSYAEVSAIPIFIGCVFIVIITIMILVDIFNTAGFTFFLLIIGFVLGIKLSYIAFDKDDIRNSFLYKRHMALATTTEVPREIIQNEKKSTACYIKISVLYYIIMAVYVILLFVAY